MDGDDIFMIAADAGAEDLSDEEDSFEIITAPDDFSKVVEALEAADIKMASAEITMIPQNYGSLTDEEDIKCLNRILDLLEDDDDVQDVYTNYDEA
jgi:transcriptional/translational regulatory protein YebC/TACO1